MSPMPLGWSVGVDGTRVVLRVSARPDDWFWLSAAEVETLISQMQFAQLTARRKRLAELDPDALTSEVQRDIDAHLEMYGRYAVDVLRQVDVDSWTGKTVSGEEFRQRFPRPEPDAARENPARNDEDDDTPVGDDDER